MNSHNANGKLAQKWQSIRIKELYIAYVFIQLATLSECATKSNSNMDLNNNNVISDPNVGKENDPEVDEAGPFSQNATANESAEADQKPRSFFADCSIDEDGSFTFQRNWPSIGKKITLSPRDSENLLDCLYDVMSISKDALDKFDGTIMKKRECPLIDDSEHKITCFVERSPLNDYVYRVEVKEYDSLGFYLPDVDYEDRPKSNGARGRRIAFKHDMPMVEAIDHGFWILRSDRFPTRFDSY